jgi:hypothetical protein
MIGYTPLAYPATEPPAGYRPGACNIGSQEIRRRWLSGHAGLVATVGLLVVLLAIDAAPPVRLLVGLPAAGAAIGYLQAYLRFCAAFGLAGIYSFGNRDDAQAVTDSSARARDRRRALMIVGAGVLIGLVVGIGAMLLP